MNSRLNQFASLAAMTLLAGCHSTPATAPRAPAPSVPASVPSSAGQTAAAPASAAKSPSSPGQAGSPAGGAAAAEPVAIPPRAAQQYSQALQLMKSGRKTDAELEFKQLIVAYPQFAGPQINLGLLYLHDSRLSEA